MTGAVPGGPDVACPICRDAYGPDVVCLGTTARARAARRTLRRTTQADRRTAMAQHPSAGTRAPLAPEPPYPPAPQPAP